MKYFFSLILATCWCFGQVNAQFNTPGVISNPVSWQFSVKKLDNEYYRFEAKATMTNGFHIWAQDPGGDGSLIPTSFTAEGLAGGAWSGEWEESKKAVTQELPYIDGAIHWHEKEVTFYRKFKANKGDKIKGAVQYQSCNDEVCLPPAIENFVVLVN